MRKGFHAPYSNHGHNEGLAGDGLSEWHSSFVQLAVTLEGCARRSGQDCRRYRPRGKPARKSCCSQGDRIRTCHLVLPKPSAAEKADPSAGLDSRTEVTAVTGF